MAETKSSGEIEDILSSIRRLVSEDLRPAARQEIVSRLVVEDKLILTPALRVVPGAPKQPAGGHEYPSPAALPRLHLGAVSETKNGRTGLVATLTKAVAQQPMDWDSETGDPAPDLESLDWSSFTFARRSQRETFATQLRMPETAAPQPKASEVGASSADEVSKPPQPVEVEAPMAGDDQDSDWADEAEAEVLADLKQAEAEVLPGPETETDSIFSEQVLRELVRDLIREQLQGDLGERITRNIRKLVKAEIARALDVRALD